MQTRISAVQQALVVLLAAAIAIALVARPTPQNGRLHHALAELEAFRDSFERPRVEQSLLEYALNQGRKPLSELQTAAANSGKNVPALQLAPNAPPLSPLASVRLATLADVQHFAKPSSTLPIAVADSAPLGLALGWRLVRSGVSAPVVIEHVELHGAKLDAHDIAQEVEVARLQAEYGAAQQAVAAATRDLSAAEQLLETRRKWKLPWKVLLKTDEARKQVKSDLEAKQRGLRELTERYEAAVARTTTSHEPLETSLLPAFGLAHVAITQAGQATSFEIPVQLAVREVPVPSLPGGEFRETHNAGLWDEVHGLDAEHAIAALRAHFTWHYRYVELLGVKLGGMTVLQLLPCLLPLLLAFSVLRMRRVSDAYNPFGTRVTGRMPRVGFGARSFDALVVVVLPLAAAGCAVASLLLVGQVPALPMLTSVVCLGLGVYTFMKLGELQTLMEDVVRSHSNPPPPDDDR